MTADGRAFAPDANRYVGALALAAPGTPARARGLAFLAGIRLLMGPTFEQFMLCYVFWVPWDRVLYNAPLYAAHAAAGAGDGGLRPAAAATGADARPATGH